MYPGSILPHAGFDTRKLGFRGSRLGFKFKKTYFLGLSVLGLACFEAWVEGLGIGLQCLEVSVWCFQVMTLHGTLILTTKIRDRRVIAPVVFERFQTTSGISGLRSCSRSIRLPEHPQTNHNNVRVRVHSMMRASMPKP